MRRSFLFIRLVMAAALLAPIAASAQSPPQAVPATKDLKTLFDKAQKLGTDSELRGDIADRLGLGEHPLIIKDLVINADGVQHALNAFTISDTSYLLFDSHLHTPDVYIFVKKTDGTLVAGIRGRQYEPISSTVDTSPTEAAVVAEAEEDFWFQWLADGAKMPPPVN